MDYTKCFICGQSLADYTPPDTSRTFSGYDISLWGFDREGSKLCDCLDSIHDGYLCGDCASAALRLIRHKKQILYAILALLEATEPDDVQEVGGEPLEQARAQANKALDEFLKEKVT